MNVHKCGATIEKPTVKDGGRPRPLWRSSCNRRVDDKHGDHARCFQHRPAVDSSLSKETEK